MVYNLYNLAFAGLLFIFIVNRVRSNISVARFKKAQGCQPEKRLAQRERILGWDLYSAQVQASKDKNILEAGLKRFNDTGPTYSAGKQNNVRDADRAHIDHMYLVLGMLGRTFINTIDPEIVKTVLATSFKDFGLGTRHRSFGPLLGHGIFTSDGALWEHSRVRFLPT
jgi:hypothetical protein